MDPQATPQALVIILPRKNICPLLRSAGASPGQRDAAAAAALGRQALHITEAPAVRQKQLSRRTVGVMRPRHRPHTTARQQRRDGAFYLRRRVQWHQEAYINGRHRRPAAAKLTAIGRP